MAVYILRRSLATIPVLLGVALAVFMMLHFLPGDPVLVMMSESGSGLKMADGSLDAYERIRHELGLDQPLHVQFVRFLANAARGDLGRSWRSNQEVTAMIAAAMPHTMRLALAGLGLAIPFGMFLGGLAAVKHNSLLDTASMFLALFAVSMPSFWFGIMLILIFSLHLRLLPAVGYGDPRGIILPAIALGLSSAAIIARLTRSSLLEVLSMDFIVTARAKGLRGRTVILRHAMKNSLIPVVTVVGLQFGALLSGSIVIETVFARPGLGGMLIDGIRGKDFPVLQGGIMVTTLIYVLTSLLVDISYAFIDPRIRHGESLVK